MTRHSTPRWRGFVILGTIVYMNRQSVLRDLVAVGILVAVLHQHAIENAWYWSYWWMDIITHFLGGLFVGLLAFWFVTRILQFSLSGKKLFYYIVGSTILVGIGWEIFEFSAGLVIAQDPIPDIILDLVMDIIGALSAYLYVFSGESSEA